MPAKFNVIFIKMHYVKQLLVKFMKAVSEGNSHVYISFNKNNR